MIIIATAPIINSLVCMEPVRPRQQGVQCDGCFPWSHRICNTGKLKKKNSMPIPRFYSNAYFWIDVIGISLEVYRAAVRKGNDIEWRCILCEYPNAESTMESLPDAESTRVEYTSKPNLIIPYLMLKAPESSLLLRVLCWKTMIYCQPATSTSTHQLRYLWDLSPNSLWENKSRAALLVSNILFHIHALLADQGKKIERNLK